MNIYYVIVIVGIFASACSQILLKQSAKKTHHYWIYEYLNWRVMLSYSIFFCSMVVNIIGLKNGVRLKDLPILESLAYVFVPILSFVFLSEKLTKKISMSIFIIVVGIIIFYQ